MFGDRVKELRIKAGLNQTEMANRLNLGQTQVSHIEIHRNEPDLKTIVAYCKYFNVSADYLLGIIDTEKPLK